MASKINSIGDCGTGLTGASWTGIFLAKGMRVLVYDPAPGAKEKLDAHLKDEWSVLERIGLGSGTSLSEYELVGASLDGHLGEVDFFQGVLRSPFPPSIFPHPVMYILLSECTRAPVAQARSLRYPGRQDSQRRRHRLLLVGTALVRVCHRLKEELGQSADGDNRSVYPT